MDKLISNKKAYFNYEILETFEAGVALLGSEVKALRANKAHLQGAYITLNDGEAFLRKAYIAPYQESNTPSDYSAERPRKLLLKQKELAQLTRELNTAGLTVVPLKWYNKKRKIKLEIALVRGKKKVDKRESIKARDVKRDINRTLKNQ